MIRATQKSKRPAALFFCALVIVGMVLFMFSSAVPRFPALFQFGGVLLITAGVYVATRYVAVSFIYTVQSRGEDETDPMFLDFCVTKVQGNRSWDLCRLALSDLVSVTAEDGSKKKDGKPVAIYNYCDTLFSKERTRLLFADGEELFAIVIDADSAFIEAVRRERERIRRLTELG